MATYDSYLDCKDACAELYAACDNLIHGKNPFLQMASHFQHVLATCERNFWKASDFQALTDDVRKLIKKIEELRKIQEKKYGCTNGGV